jgi:general secretion pathway protein A
MYEAFYGLTERPFRLVPAPDCLYLSGKHQRALTYLQYGVMEDVGFVLLTGEIGTGKTTLIRHLLSELDADVQAGVVCHTHLSSLDLLRRALQSFDLPAPEGGKAQLLHSFHQFLIENHDVGKRTLLVIDEAQNLSMGTLEEVRMLSNFQNHDRSLLQVMLVGQPELRTRLKDPRFSSLTQRVAVSYHLGALTRDEARDYMAFRLERAGGTLDLFEPKAVDLICHLSGGIPRTINLLCDAALVYGFGYELKTIGVPVIREVVMDKGGLGLKNLVAEPKTVQDPETGEAAPAPDPAAEDGYLKRLETLETNLSKLNLQTEWQVEELERQVEASKADLVENLKKLIDEERQKYNKLLIKYTLLKYSHKKLEDQLNGNGKGAGRAAVDFGALFSTPLAWLKKQRNHDPAGSEELTMPDTSEPPQLESERRV